MNGFSKAIILIAIMFAKAPFGDASELDDSSYAYSVSPRTVKWENVRSGPQWLHGEQPAEMSNGLFQVCLAGSQFTTFRVARQEVIRIVSVDGTILPNQIEVWSSDGSSLYRRLPVHQNSIDGSLFAAPGHANLSLAMVRLAPSVSRSVQMVLFTSRHDAAAVVDEYQCPVEVDGALPVQLHRRCDQSALRFWRIDANQTVSMTITGPVRLRFDTRFRFQPNESQSRQTYHLFVDGHAMQRRVLDFASSSDFRNLSVVDNQPESLGSRSDNYLDVAVGTHRLTLTSTSPIYLRVDAKNGSHWRRQRNSSPLRRSRLETRRVLGSHHNWQTPSQHLLESLNDPRDSSSFVNAAFRAARDNRFSEGGLQAYMLMRAAAAARSHQIELRQISERLRLHRTFFRDLLPSWQPFPVEPTDGYFASWRLREPSAPRPHSVLGDELIDDGLRQLSQARFVSTSTSQQTASVYHLPKNLGASLLRVAVDRTSLPARTKLYVQYDRQAPIELLSVQREPLAAGDYSPSRAAIALVGQRARHGDADHATLGGPFCRDRHPAPYIAAGVCELVLPAGVRQIRVWADGKRGSQPRLALQYRASRPFLPSESSYQGLAGRLSAKQRFATLRNDNVALPEDFAELESENLYHPLRRLLMTHRRVFEAGVADNRSVSPIAALELSRPESAELFSSQGYHVAAVEAWTKVMKSPDARRRTALFARTRALRSAGEDFLADRELRGLYLFDEDPEVRRDALQQMLRNCQLRSDGFAWEQIVSTAVLRDAAPEDLNELAAALIENGRYDFALFALLAAPEENRSAQLMARCCFAERWWHTLDTCLPRLPSEQQILWRAHRFAFQGRYDEATTLYLQGGAAGQSWAEHLHNGQQINRRIRSHDLATRVSAFLDWEGWDQHHPGERVWREEPQIVFSSSGCRAVVHRSRGVYSQYYLSQAKRPIRLRVCGPARLKLETRPVHDRHAEGPLNGWLYVSGDQGKNVFPITNNFASTELAFVGNDHQVPGGLVPTELSIGPGVHEFTVHSEESDVVVRAFVERPEVPLGVLPPITANTCAAAISGVYADAAFDEGTQHALRLLGENNIPSEPLPIAVPRMSRPLNSWSEIRSLLEAGRSRSEDVRRASTTGVRQTVGRIAVGESHAEADDRASLVQHINQLVYATERQPSSRLQNICEAWQWIDSRPDLPVRSLRSRLMRNMTWEPFREFQSSAGVHSVEVPFWSPESPALRIRKSMMHGDVDAHYVLQPQSALVLDVQTSWPRELKVALTRPKVSFLTHWETVVSCQVDQEPVTEVRLDDSAATIPIALPPGHHKLRMWVNTPLANHFVLVRIESDHSRPALHRLPSAETVRGASVTTDPPLIRPRERYYQVATREQPVVFGVAAPAMLRIDELRDGQILSQTVTVTEGYRDFKLRPTVNRDMAMFRVFEFVPSSHSRVSEIRRPTSRPEPIPSTFLQPYVDDLFPGSEQSSNEATSIGHLSDTLPWQTSRESADASRWITSNWSDASIPKVLEPSTIQLVGHDVLNLALGIENPASLSRSIAWEDAGPLMNQRYRTWAYSLGVFQRRPIEESQDVAVPGRFLQSDVAHYSWDEWTERYRETHVFGRARNAAGPTFGFSHEVRSELPAVPPLLPFRWRCRCEPHPLETRWGFASYLQMTNPNVPDDTLLWSGRIHGGLARRYGISRDWSHRPAVSAFFRPLAARGDNGFTSGDVDQDVFTPYKRDHQWGIRFSDRFSFRPYTDTRWWLRPSMTMNEDIITPDNVGIQLGTTQLLGSWDIDASYRLTEYFRDDDRRRSSSQQVIYLDAVFERWKSSNLRHELGARVRHDLERGETNANVTWTIFANDRRGYRDLHPSRTRFYPTKAQQAFRSDLLN